MTTGPALDSLEVWVLLVERPLDTGADLSLHWHELEARHAARRHMEAAWPDHLGPMPSDVNAAIETTMITTMIKNTCGLNLAESELSSQIRHRIETTIKPKPVVRFGVATSCETMSRVLLNGARYNGSVPN